MLGVNRHLLTGLTGASDNQSSFQSGQGQPEPDFSCHRWRVPVGRRLGWRTWDRAGIVHDPASGETHYLNLLSMVALEHLEEADLSLDELAAKMSVYLDVERAGDFENQVAALVQQFDILGLIEPCKVQ